MPDFIPNALLLSGQAVTSATPPALGGTPEDTERTLLVDCCRIDQSAKGPRPFMIVVMDTATRLVLSTAIATDSALADSVVKTIKDAIATDPGTLGDLPVACDFCDRADLDAGLADVAPHTRVVIGHGGPRTRGWAERQVRAAAFKAESRD
ncbi:hypothetical protein ACFSX5_15225 [Devosia albogilva]|uniref:Integrase catalytic domain-containing protein n=1 Tax=Devosia albogilva TaxID=429726 RepID=A0ABW5QNA1_9HYPH